MLGLHMAGRGVAMQLGRVWVGMVMGEVGVHGDGTATASAATSIIQKVYAHVRGA